MNEDFDRSLAYKKTERAYKLWHLFTENPGIFIDKEQRVKALKTLSGAEFIRFLSFANGLLKRGKPANYDNSISGMTVGTGLTDESRSVEFEASENSRDDFLQFFTELSEKISPDNIKHWATKLYVAIIFAHLFEDGNGRLSRAAYTFLMTGSMLDENSVMTRPDMADRVASSMYNHVFLKTLRNEVPVKKDEQGMSLVWEYGLVEGDEDISFAGLSSIVRYIAGVRVLKNHNLFDLDKHKAIDLNDEVWNENLRDEYFQQKEALLSELFFSIQDTIDQFPDWAEEEIDKIFPDITVQ